MNQPYVPLTRQNTFVGPRTEFHEAVEATVGYRLEPLIQRGIEAARFGRDRQPGYNPLTDLPDSYIPYSADLYRATSPEHRAFLMQGIDESMERRRVLADATLGNQFLAGIFDPINLIAIPIGPGSNLLRTAGRAALGVGMVEAGYEATVMQLDPVQTVEESAMNVVTSALFGGVVGSALSAPRAIADASYSRIQQGMGEVSQAMERLRNLEGMSAQQIRDAAPRTEREFGAMSNEELGRNISSLEARASRLMETAEEGPGGQAAREQAQEIQLEAQRYRNESGLRSIEEMNARGVDDPYGILPNMFTNSIFYRAVTTPMRRALQSQWGSSVKETFYRSFGDHSIALGLNSIGQASPPTVFIRSQVAMGRVIQSYDRFTRLWAEETGIGPSAAAARTTDLARRVNRSDDTFSAWLERVNEKRIQGDTNLTPREQEAVNIMNDYFLDAQGRLEEVGLIGTRAGLENRITRMETRIEELQTRLNSANTRARPLIESRIKELEGNLRFTRATLADFSETDIANPDVFNPRFWDHAAIRNNREEFSRILYDWYSNNPVIREYNERTGRFEQVRLSTRRADIEKRVSQTIDQILGERDPTSIESATFGYGRSKHFRSRELDIPNRLVTKFMHTDVMSVMKAYANRIEPRYEYSRMFGMEVDDVRLNLRLDMIEQGASQREINRMNKDYIALYERVAGTTRHNPDSWSHRTADTLRELASMNYLGSSGFAAFADFGRVVMEYDMEHIIRGMQGVMDQYALKMSIAETRRGAQAAELTLNSSHLRMMSEGQTNFTNNGLINNARNAFFVMNGLGPVTVMLKNFAGIVDAHTIIDYSIKLTRGQLDEQSTIWLAKHGIDERMAREIASAPFETTNYGLHLANTENWVNNYRVPTVDDNRVTIVEYVEGGEPVGKFRGNRYIPAYYRPNENGPGGTIYFDRDYIEGEMYNQRPWANPKIEGVTPLPDDAFPTPRSWANFVMHHEIAHTRHSADSLGFVERPNLRDISDDDLGSLFDYLSEITSREEKDSNPADWTAAERAAHERGDWREFSRLRGYSARQIDTYAEWLNVAKEYIRRNGEDDAASRSMFHSPEVHDGLDVDALLRGLEASRPSRVNIAAYENRINEMAMQAHRESQAISADAVEAFRSALHTGVLNTIMSGTPADRPIITDGVVYIPMSVAARFGMKESASTPGYARIENGFLGLPFQFFNYALANVNRTMGAFAQGQIKNRMIGLAASLGLGYMVVGMRTPDYIWEDMNWRDRFARSFDMSGVAALYSDLFYTGMHTALALGGPNITGGLISPKFPQRTSLFDAVTGLAGAGPSWAADVGEGFYEMYSGEYGEGARRIFRDLPFMRLWFIKDEVNQLTRAWAG
jgi:hypothetical protein